MRADIYWVGGPWSGKLALAARPRGEDWLAEEINGWKRDGIRAVLSLLTSEEERELGLQREQKETKALGLEFWSFPIADRQVPNSEISFRALLNEVDAALSAGTNVLVHCRQGIGRTGMVAIGLLMNDGLSLTAAIDSVSTARGIAVPETIEQREWLDRYARVRSK